MSRPDSLPAWEGRGWFRTRLTVAPGEAPKDIVISMEIAGACEVYLDGTLLGRIGAFTPSGDIYSWEMVESGHSMICQDLEAGEHVLAIHVANPPMLRRLHMLVPGIDDPFRLEINGLEQDRENFRKHDLLRTMLSLLLGLGLSIGFYHLIIWRSSNSRSKEDKYFGLFSIFLACRALALLLENGILGQGWFPFIFVADEVLLLLTMLYLTKSVQILVAVGSRTALWIIASAMGVAILSHHLLGLSFLPLIVVLNKLYLLAVTIIAIRKNRNNAFGVALVEISLLLGILVVARIAVAIEVNILVLKAIWTFALILPTSILAVLMAKAHASNQVQLRLELEQNAELRRQAVDREHELRMRDIAALEMKAELERERLTVTQQTAGGIAHEFNTPLAVANLSAELIISKAEDNRPTEEIVPYAKRMIDAVEKMSAIVKKLLTISKVELKPYAGDSEVLDIEKSSEKQDKQAG